MFNIENQHCPDFLREHRSKIFHFFMPHQRKKSKTIYSAHTTIETQHNVLMKQVNIVYQRKSIENAKNFSSLWLYFIFIYYIILAIRN